MFDSPEQTESEDEARKKVTVEATRLIAATVVCDPDFPAEHLLPRLAPIPHGNLGHQILLDYPLLAQLLWGAERQVREHVRADRGGCVGAAVGLFVFLIGSGVGFAVAMSSRRPEPGPAFLVAGVSALVGLLVWQFMKPDINRLIADARAEYLKELLAGQTPEAAEEFTAKVGKKTFAEWGDGALGGSTVPVLVMFRDSVPFPGYGRHQSRELFVCRPRADDPPTEHSAARLNADVSRALTAMIRTAGIACVSSGQVVLLDGETLRKDSPWLASGRSDTGGRPPLWLTAPQVAEVQNTDPNASARVYTCVQAVVPEYAMCLTFFVRTFLAGNSAACEVNVCTLGPPIQGWDYIRDKLRVHRRESRDGAPAGAEPEERRPERTTALGARLEYIRYAVENTGMVFRCGTPKATLPKLDPFDKDALDHEVAQVRAITKNSDVWPGRYTEPTNWRESFSLTFTTDFFGNTESQAILRTLFDRICRQALSALKELKYDVSDYQDESGQFHINAEKIEQLVVGEKVYVDPKKRKKNKGADEGEGANANVGEGSAA